MIENYWVQKKMSIFSLKIIKKNKTVEKNHI